MYVLTCDTDLALTLDGDFAGDLETLPVVN